jgi:hypothetical protein
MRPWLAGLALLIVSTGAAAQTNRIPTLKRLEPEYLKRVREEAAAFAKARQPVALKTGFGDYRCVIHAHSHLSHDSRGTIAEIAAAAKAVGVDAVFLSNHPKPDLDVVAAGQTTPVDGVLFVAGAETNGFAAYPGDGKLPPTNVGEQAFVDSIVMTGGLVFFAHPEEHADWTIRGLTGTEIYNTHADVEDEKELLAALQPRDSKGYLQLLKLLNTFKDYPQEAFAALFDAPTGNLARFDALCKTRPYAATAGNDSHQNTGFVLKGTDDDKIAVEDPLGERLGTLDPARNPLLVTLFGKPEPGREMMRRLLDPYPVSFHYVSTHVLARERTVPSLEAGLKAARTYVAFDWMADPTGTVFIAEAGGRRWTIGDTVALSSGLTIRAEVPVAATLRLMRDGTEVARAEGRTLRFPVDAAGVYRIEVSLPLAGENRPWIYTGVILVTADR